MPVDLPESVGSLIGMLEKSGFDAYAVGGCVRDSLMGIVPHDWDICTSATPEEMKRCFRDLRVVETGIRHGTLTVLVGDEPFEVTTYRVDGKYLDNRHPSEVLFVRSLTEDLSRRDFTINAMAYSDGRGLVDPFGGESDLKAGLIRCVGDPGQRFGEDALRIIRALRFASVFRFDIEPSTAASVHRNKDLLNNIAAERINTELGKLLCGRNASSVLREYADVIAVFIPEILPMIGFRQDNPFHCFDVWEHTVRSVAAARDQLTIRLTMLLHDVAKPACFSRDDAGVGHFYGHPVRSADIAESIMKRLRCDAGTTETVKTLILYHDTDIKPEASRVKRLLNKLGPDNLKLLLDVKGADYSAQNPEHFPQKKIKLDKFRTVLDTVLEEAQCFRLQDLAVGGNDLIAAGIPQGVRIGETLKTLLDMVIDEKLENKKEVLLETAKKMI